MPTAITFMAPLRTNRYRSNRIRNNRRRGNNFLLHLHRVIRRNWVARTAENPHTLLGHVAGLATQPTKNTERADLGTMTWPWPTEHWESWQEYHTRQSKPSIWIKPGISLESRVFTTRFQFCKAGKHRNNRTQHAGLPHSLRGQRRDVLKTVGARWTSRNSSKHLLQKKTIRLLGCWNTGILANWNATDRNVSMTDSFHPIRVIGVPNIFPSGPT